MSQEMSHSTHKAAAAEAGAEGADDADEEALSIADDDQDEPGLLPMSQGPVKP